MLFENNKVIIGSWLCSTSSIVAELMSICGFDFLTIDVEHSPIDIENAFQLLQAIRSGNNNCKALVRVAENRYSEIKRFMDAGADGIICPMINSKEEAQSLVDAVKYPPLGKRGIGFARSNNYGLNLVQSVSNSNNETFVCVQIENVKAVENIREILSIKGIDAVLIGPYDLSSSMNILGQLTHPKMEEAISIIMKACIENGVMPGIHIVQPDSNQVKQRISQGYQFIAYSVDITMISTMANKLFDELNAKTI